MATTNRGWPYPVGTDAVVDGDNAIRAVAEKLDNNLGLTLIKTVQTDGTSTIILDNVFTPNFMSYHVSFSLRHSIATGTNMVMRKNGADYINASGHGISRFYLSSNTGMTASYVATSAFVIGAGTPTKIAGDLDIYSAQDPTNQLQILGTTGGLGVAGIGNQLVNLSQQMGVTDDFTGFRFALTSGGATYANGFVSVYGKR